MPKGEAADLAYPAHPVTETVQRLSPYGPLMPRRVLPLAAEHINPVVRIAHRLSNPLEIAERILFDHEFVLILTGSGELVREGKSCPYQAHDLLLLPPFVPHRFAAPAPDKSGHIAVHFDFAPHLGDGIDSADNDLPQRLPYEVRLVPALHIPPRQFVPPGSLLETTLHNLVREHERQDPLTALRVRREMLSLLAAVLSPRQQEESLSAAPHGENQAKQQVRVRRVVDFIQSHLHDHLDAYTLAATADMSVSRFNTVFREETGYSPLEFVRHTRVAHARTLLRDPERPIKEIAARCGFDDAFHFSRVFRQVDGLSPTQYRDALLASQPQVLARAGETDKQ